jgi:hypothetical protein
VLHSCSYTHLAPVCHASHLSRRPSCTYTVRRPLGPHVCLSLVVYLMPHAWLGSTHQCTALAFIRARAARLSCASRVSLSVVPALLLCCSASLHPVARTTTATALVLPPHCVRIYILGSPYPLGSSSCVATTWAHASGHSQPPAAPDHAPVDPRPVAILACTPSHCRSCADRPCSSRLPCAWSFRSLSRGCYPRPSSMLGGALVLLFTPFT